MCGIVGAINHNNIANTLHRRLKLLEYRGYDSFGLFARGAGKSISYKNLGAPSKDKIKHKKFIGSGIAHTRWATHGEVKLENTHPIKVENLLIVHNGTIDTKSLKKEFDLDDYETDTEYLLQAINKEYTRLETIDDINLLYFAVKKVIDFAEKNNGVGAFLLMHGSIRHRIIAYSDKCPLYFCSAKERKLIGSDTKIFKGMPAIKLSGLHLIDYTTEIEGEEIDTTLNKAPKRKDHMLEEIKEQIHLCKRDTELKLFHPNKLIFVGCGSSYYAGMVCSYLLDDDNECYCRYASEFTSRSNIVDDALYILISQSGETKDVIDAAKIIDRKMGNILVVQNTENSTLSQYGRETINIKVGPEIGVAATKSFFKTVLELTQYLYFEDELSENIEKTISNLSTDFHKEDLEKISKYKNILFLGQGVYYPIALEAALKVKEIAYIHAEAMPASEVKHGPLALIDDDTLTIALISHNQPNYQSVLDNINQVISRGGEVIVFTDDKNLYVNGDPTTFFLPELKYKSMQCLIYLVAMQMLAYNLATIKGHDVDKPRNLAKSVTV